MLHHQVKGYQTNFKNDLYMVEEQLQEYDPDLYIMFNPNDGTWLIMDGVTEMAIMKIPQTNFETLDSRVVSHIKKIHVSTGFNALWEVEEADRRIQREMERRENDLIEDFSKELLPAAREMYNTGRTEGVKAYY